MMRSGFHVSFPHLSRLTFATITISIIVFGALIFVLFNGLDNIGLEYDELYSINAALGCPNEKMFLNYFKYRFGVCIPIMIMQYSGAPIAIIPAISIHLFEPSVWSIRGFNMVILLAVLVFFFTMLRKKLGFMIAILTILFLTFDVQFIFTSQLEKPTLFPFMLRLAVLSVLLTPPFRYKLFLLGFLAGFSIYTKLDAAFFLLALAIGWFFGSVINLPRLNLFLLIKSYNPRKLFLIAYSQLLPLTLGFIFGILPFLKYFQTHPESVLGVIGTYQKQTANQTIPLRVDSFFRQLTNSDYFEYVFRQPISLDYVTQIASQILIFFWLLAAGYLIVNKKYNKLAIPVLAFFVIYLLYPTLAGSHHRLIIYPLPQLILAIFFKSIYDLFKNVYLKNYFLVVCVGLYLLVFIPVYTQTVEWGRKTCGTVSFNCAIYPLANNIKNEKKTVVVGDWGISTQLLYLTSGKIPIYEAVFDAWLLKPEELKNTLAPYLDNCSPIVLRNSKIAKFQVADQNIRQILKVSENYYSVIIKDKNQVPQYEVFRSVRCK